ncbi:unnamed protein product [Sphagnum jensenii]|uniref:Secreted protein n=1 Tax=Sphagnum jensenii TaxID=128206 RepID=A0ABP1AUC9_9BRYO
MGFHLCIYGLLSTFSFSFFFKDILTNLFSGTLLRKRAGAHGGQWRDEQEATCELGASYVKKLFGTLFSFSKTNIQSPKFASF